MHMFYFTNLVEGTYKLTVEADGYETYHGTHTVIPGQFDERGNMIHIKPLRETNE